jgi:hypothetical protein
MTWGNVAMAAGSVVGAAISSRGARSAAQSQADATQRAIDAQNYQFDRVYTDQAPYREQGVNALRTLAGEVDQMPTAADVMRQPGYQFGLNQGQQAIQRQFGARGGRVSGAAMKAAAEYGTNYAASGYNAEYQRRQDRLNRLAALAGIGQTATQASGQAGMQAGANTANLLSSQGDATGAARMAQGNIWGNAIGDVAAAYNRYTRQNPGGNTGNFQSTEGVGGLSAGQGLNGWW